MTDYIDLVLVEYKDSSREICYAPRGEVNIGDDVITKWGDGKVIETLFTYSEDEVFKFFRRNTKIHPVLYKPIKYKEGDNSDLSERSDD